ncbi:Hypothetical predicted protein [Cloeon dipterum]|uniref:Uncharacterized protein n=1 Tax=Cloeon dipterum TaxID=197152 RepID=A0A8S1C6X1_9INSE|nr:Hypothetical predicted protein [Cloeon dipterum]
MSFLKKIFAKPGEMKEDEMERILKKLEELGFSGGSSFDQVWVHLVDELKVLGPKTSGQKLQTVAKMILKFQTKTFCFFPIMEFFEGNSRFMVEILQKISGKREITEFRFLKDDSIKNKKELDEWNDNSLPEILKSDLEKVRVELKNMRDLHTIKIDAYPICLNDLMDLCENLRFLTTVEVVLNHVIHLDVVQSKLVRKSMGHLEIFKYTGVVKNNFYKHISFFEHKLDKFFIRLLPHAKIIGQPGRFVDIKSVVEKMDEHNDESRLTHIAHKMMGHITQPLSTFFPNLNHLQIDWSQTDSQIYKFYGFLMFPELTHLTLIKIPELDFLWSFTLAYRKHRLSELTVDFKKSPKLSMKTFRGFYMTLRKLVVGVITPLVGGNSVWSLEKFESLKELEISFAVNRDFRGAICVVPICSIFLAPNLEKVRLLGQLAVDAEHLQLMQLLREGSATVIHIRSSELDKKVELCKGISKFYKKKVKLT